MNKTMNSSKYQTAWAPNLQRYVKMLQIKMDLIFSSKTTENHLSKSKEKNCYTCKVFKVLRWPTQSPELNPSVEISQRGSWQSRSSTSKNWRLKYNQKMYFSIVYVFIFSSISMASEKPLILSFFLFFLPLKNTMLCFSSTGVFYPW